MFNLLFFSLGQCARMKKVSWLSLSIVGGARARVTQRTLFLSTYSDDLNCSNIVYARIDNDICTDTSVCTIRNDSDGSFHDTELTACILDREAYLKTAFKGSPYLTVELYPTDCLGKSYNTRSFIADGNCHPYKDNHFKVVQTNGTISVLSAESGCESTDWQEEWKVNSDTQLNTEACVTDGTNTWKSYFIAETTVIDESTSPPPTTVPTPTSTTEAPVATTTAPQEYQRFTVRTVNPIDYNNATSAPIYLRLEANTNSLASHLFWALWGYIQASQSTIDFDFLAYGKCRYDASRIHRV
ncbi:Choline/ethanolamine kinase [Phytophthora megakarya]|uniref:Choline/ethanolamine kinase n=1 Tax=Phytophthora megakarya TaxID=4795 RepID=A0A225WLK5_9STRA|nr:Choline/ethanolamine kinase [Phytophthora megakarya]